MIDLDVGIASWRYLHKGLPRASCSTKGLWMLLEKVVDTHRGRAWLLRGASMVTEVCCREYD